MGKLRSKLSEYRWINLLYDRYCLLFKRTFCADRMATCHAADFLQDPRFTKALEAARKQDDLDIPWRAYNACYLVEQALKNEGDFVECGVNKAFLSMAAVVYTQFEQHPDRSFYLVDTYEGMVPELIAEDDTAAFRRNYSDCYEFVLDSFKDYSNVSVVKGIVPEVLPHVESDRIAYLSLDMNCAPPEEAALEYFWPKMVSGGFILLDDYGYSGYENQRKVHNAFAEAQGVSVLALPTGQGLIIKPQCRRRTIRSNSGPKNSSGSCSLEAPTPSWPIWFI